MDQEQDLFANWNIVKWIMEHGESQKEGTAVFGKDPWKLSKTRSRYRWSAQDYAQLCSAYPGVSIQSPSG